MKYRCIAKSRSGFVQQLAVQYVTHGYWWYVAGWIPEKKDPESVDERLVERYDITPHQSERWRRKKQGRANLQYLRFGRSFVLIASKGEHLFYGPADRGGESQKKLVWKGERRSRTQSLEEVAIRDIRKHPLQFEGYSIGWRNGHPSVRIAHSVYVREKAHLEEMATRRRTESMVELIRKRVGYFEPYAPVRDQLLCIIRAVNRRRVLAGYERLPDNTLRLRRRIYRPFDSPHPVTSSSANRLAVESGVGNSGHTEPGSFPPEGPAPRFEQSGLQPS